MSYFKGITKITKELYVEKLAKGEIDPDRLYFVYDADGNYTREEIDALFVTLENALQSSVADIVARISELDEKKATVVYVDDSIKALLGGEVDEAYDTFKEIQDLMKEDDAAAAALIKSVNKNATDIETVAQKTETFETEISVLKEQKANADNVYTKKEVEQAHDDLTSEIQSVKSVLESADTELQETLQNSVSAINKSVSELDKKKYDKTGGIIEGNVSIQGNLSVAGTTTTQDTETLCVKDNVVVANSNGVKLIEEGGFAIRTDTTNVYGIMYDPVGDGVKIGLGTFDENGKFIFTGGEAQFLATRADEIADGNLPKWNNEKKRFDDSGEKIEDFQKSKDETLETKVKEVAGAINEVNEKTDGNANSLTALVEALAELMPEVVRVY